MIKDILMENLHHEGHMDMKVLTDNDEIEEDIYSDSSLEDLPPLIQVEESLLLAAKSKIRIQIKFVGELIPLNVVNSLDISAIDLKKRAESKTQVMKRSSVGELDKKDGGKTGGFILQPSDDTESVTSGVGLVESQSLVT